MSDSTNQAMLEELRALREQGAKDSVIIQQMLKQQLKSESNYPPHQRKSPKPPSVLAQERQSQTTPGTDSVALQANREVHEKVVAPVLGGVIGKLFSKNKQPVEDDSKPGLLTTLKQALSPVSKSSSKTIDKNIPTPPAEKERRVVNKAEEVTITDISPKARKGFSSIFSGLFTKSKPTKPTSQAGDKSSGGGFFSSLLGMLLGSGGISGLGSMFTGMFLMPLLKAVGGGLMSVLTAPFKLAGWGLGKAIDGITWASRLVGKSKIGQMVGGLFTGMGNKIMTGLDIVRKSRVGQAVTGLFTNITTRLSGIGGSIMTGLSKIPGVGKLISGVSTGLGSVTTALSGMGSLGSLAGKALRFAGPVGAIIGTGISAFKGASTAIDEYKKSGSLAAAAREGLASFTESFTFGLLDKEAVSSGLSKAGDMIASVSDTVVGSVKGLWGKAKGFLFGSPHASTYVDAASNTIHDGTVKLADSSLRVANASMTFSEASEANQKNLLQSANNLDKVSADVSKSATINQQLSKNAIDKVNKSSQSLAKINSAGITDSEKILRQTQTGTKSLGERVKQAFSTFTPLGVIANAASSTIDTYKTAITRISKGESVLTVLGDTLLTNAKTALSALTDILMSPVNMVKGLLGLGDSKKGEITKSVETVTRESSTTQSIINNKQTPTVATAEQMSKLTRVNQELVKKAGKAPVVDVVNNIPAPNVKVDTPEPIIVDQTRVIPSPQPVKDKPNILKPREPVDIKLIREVTATENQSRIEQIRPVIIDKTETNNRLNQLKETKQQITTNQTSALDSQIETHLSKLVSIQEAQLQQAVASNQNTGKLSESIQNMKPEQNNVSVVNNSSSISNTTGPTSIDQYRSAARGYNSHVV